MKIDHSKANDSWRPTFIGIGAQKSATTLCWACLDEHPDVCMSYPKELDYFSDHYDRDLAWYKQHFAFPNRHVVGEISPLYMDHPEAAHRIHHHFPGVTILVILRDPFERALSNLLMDVQTERGAISDIRQPREFAERAQRDPKYIRRSLYGKALAPFVTLFGTKQIHILMHDDLLTNPRAFVHELYQAVGANPDFLPSAANRTINKTRDYRYPRLFKTLQFLSQTAKTAPITKKLLALVNRKTTLREHALEFLQVDRGRPEVEFSDVFTEADRELIEQDMRYLSEMVPLALPKRWPLVSA